MNKEKTLSFLQELIAEFKQFALRSNALDLAIGVVIGASFAKIVSALVDDLLMPFLGIFLGAVNFSGLTFSIGSSIFKYGHLIQNLLDFVIIAFCIFLLVKSFNIFFNAELGKKKISDKDIYNAIKEQTRVIAEFQAKALERN